MLKDIYFLNAKSLANELKAGTFSEYRAVKQMIVGLIIGGAGFSVPITVEFDESNIGIAELIFYLLSFIITGLISYYGAWLTHQTNNKGDSKEFFLRFISLSLPVGLQLMLLFLVVGIPLVFLTMALTLSMGTTGAYFMLGVFFVAGVIFAVIFFIRMRKFIAIAAGYNE